jgi:signal transduction histidine kinase
MKQPAHLRKLVGQLPTFPLLALHLSTGKRLLIVALCYALAIPGLWFFLPLVHNAASILLPIIAACWLFRYRGLLLCLPGILFAIWLISLYLEDYAVTPGQTFAERTVVGLGVGLMFGLVTCWLRTAIDLMLRAREQAIAAEHEQLRLSFVSEYRRQLNELKDHFLLNVSHELRTPLTTLVGSLDLLFSLDEHLDAMERAELLNMAREGHEELVNLVNQILDASHVMSEPPSVQSEVVYLQKLVEKELISLSQEHVLPYTIHFEVSSEVKVWTDPRLLCQVLHHLFSNIFKYVPRQTEITIAATQADPSSLVCLSVQDAGPGIPALERDQLFEKFGRLTRDLAGATRGTGLGLYISKRLVEAMGGRIWVESSGQTGEGSRFCIALPARSP